MEKYVADQIKYGLKYVLGNFVKSFFVPRSSEETAALRSKGFVRGVCHPNGNFEQIKNANIGWIRIDISYPFDKDGGLTDGYLHFKEKAKSYAANGIKVMAVTPYPKDYINAGIDVRLKENEVKLKEVTLFMLNNLRGIVSAIQITNEMGIPHFTIPLTMDEAARFIGVQLQTLYSERGDILIGYNSAGPQADLHLKMKPYHRYCDYIGIDIYIGCFANVGGYMWFYDFLLRYLWAFTGKPLLLQEFGYISEGQAKSGQEKLEILKTYSVSSEDEAKDDILAFVKRLPESFGKHVEKIGKGDSSRYFDLIFKSDLVNHFYRELPKRTHISGYLHSPKGQADFYRDIIPHLYKMDFLCGAFIYCYSDSESCYICGQNDCPTETRWGLVDCFGKEKPSYFAVKEAFNGISIIK